MGTPYKEVISMFMNDIRDMRLLKLLTPEELGDTLLDYLFESADVYFDRCAQDLSDRDDDLNKFNVELTNMEKRILAKGMRLKWLSSNFVANEQLLSTKLTTKDYNLFSPANQLDTLLDLQDTFKKELDSMIMKYLYRNMIRGE